MLKPEISIPVGLATGVMVLSVYERMAPSVVDMRVTEPGDADAMASLKTARWAAAGLVAAVSIIAADPWVFILGAGFQTVLEVTHRHALHVDPMTGRMALPARALADQYTPDDQP